MDNKESSVAAAFSAASEEDKSEAKNMISPTHTSCAPSNRKRPFDALEEGSGNTNDTTAATACYMSITETNGRSLSIEDIFKDMQHKMNHMQSEIDTTKAENIELKSKYYELENKVDEITSLKDEYNEGSYDNKRSLYDMQIEIDKLTKRNQELEYSVKDLTLKNEYNEWDYEADDIPDSYWIERGFDEEEHAERMGTFLGKMKDSTHELRRGEPPKNMDLLLTNGHMLHDDILLPHWKEFAGALQQYKKFNHREDYGINELRIYNVQLQQEVMDMLAPVLQTSSIKGLVLGGNIESDALLFAANIIKSNPKLRRFVWCNQIESVDDMKKLCKAIENRPHRLSFEYFGLHNTFDGNNPEMMRIVLDASRQIEMIRLDNNIGSAGAHLIANFLASNPSLDDLNLADNNLSDNDATLFANALQSNTHLRRLDLDDNAITEVGRRVLLESIFNVSSLNSCATSNRRCRIHGLNPDIYSINKFHPTSHNREMKIFTLLSGTDDGFLNMNCLGDLSYKLIPNVLSLARKFIAAVPELSDFYFEQTGQRSADWDQLDVDTVPITSMFELLRGWAVPSLSA